ncbi:MAG: hypothetical protein H6668_22830 [Ardenticatenaceae bacterium]|nr:hypothetical protein [Ardenticatenaceae bacterium]
METVVVSTRYCPDVVEQFGQIRVQRCRRWQRMQLTAVSFSYANVRATTNSSASATVER